MTKQTKSMKKFLVPGIVALLFLAGAMVCIHKANPRAELQLVLQVKMPSPDRKTPSNRETPSEEQTFRLYMGNHDPLDTRLNKSEAYQEVSFPLPRKKISNLRIALAPAAGPVAIKSLTIKGILKGYTLTGKKIQKLFSRRYQVSKHYTRRNIYYLEKIGPANWIAPGESFYTIIEQLQTNKIFYYLPAIALALMVFYLVYYYDPRPARISFNSKVLVNGVLVILIILFFPLLSQWLIVSGETQLVEKREMNREPVFRFDLMFDFFKQYTSYYNDHFVFRGDLIYLNNRFKTGLLRVSPKSRVVMGKEGWLFLGAKPNRPGTIDYYRRLTLLTQPGLESWKRMLEQRWKWLADRGIEYLFLIAPNKNTIYPEYMPDHIRPVRQQSRMDQLMVYLKEHSSVPVLDLRGPLNDAKDDYPVYSRTDSHWNDYGAYVVSREIIKYISRFPAFRDAPRVVQSLGLSHFKIETVDHVGGDMAGILSLHEEVMREDTVKMVLKGGWTFSGGKLPRISQFVRQGYSEQNGVLLPNIVMVHDSFYKRLKPFISQQFSRVVYIWDWDMNFYPAVIDREKPKLVIDEMAERFLMEPAASGGQ
ncbi:MAG: hypothetical protein GY940_36895, partial [bacterium]|nr:hypothetical protein [bacterium]